VFQTEELMPEPKSLMCCFKMWWGLGGEEDGGWKWRVMRLLREVVWVVDERSCQNPSMTNSWYMIDRFCLGVPLMCVVLIKPLLLPSRW
jgi:hypothetical protein